MLKKENSFAHLSDEEFVKRMTVPEVDEKLHEYFLYVKCAPFLKYISKKLYGSSDITILAGEFYEFIASNDWSLLRKWEGRNEASLFSYIARCATNYFINKVNSEKKRQDKEALTSEPGIIEQISSFTDESEDNSLPIWKAYSMLNERDREVLRLLVIEGHQMLSVAKDLWKFVDSKQDVSQLPAKRIQGTISMIKHRAQLALLENLEKLSRI
ncbi:MAG: hypothetical protein IKY37_05180 [Bacteroidaceae bacterium]|nr:hypothetical protein [Bacteroidaceae bacterium]